MKLLMRPITRYDLAIVEGNEEAGEPVDPDLVVSLGRRQLTRFISGNAHT
jgi:hypothetical protein